MSRHPNPRRTRSPSTSSVPGAAMSRRAFLRASTILAGGSWVVGRVARAAAAAVDNAEHLPLHVPAWSRYLGTSVDDRPYGMPSRYEAEVVRLSVPWITETRESSVNFTPLQDLDGMLTPNGLCFEATIAGSRTFPRRRIASCCTAWSSDRSCSPWTTCSGFRVRAVFLSSNVPPMAALSGLGHSSTAVSTPTA